MTLIAKDGEVAAPIEAEAPAEEASLERLLAHVPEPISEPLFTMGPQAARDPDPAPAEPVQIGAGAVPLLRTARVVSVRGKEAEIAYRGRGAAVTAVIDDGVDRALVARALLGNEAVLVEADPELGPVIVGVVQTRLPDSVEIKARKVVLDADEELLLRSGRGAMRIREDGDVELVGSRISTLSRGLFRIVGRVLRLN